jgi:hypothetical protein
MPGTKYIEHYADMIRYIAPNTPMFAHCVAPTREAVYAWRRAMREAGWAFIGGSV